MPMTPPPPPLPSPPLLAGPTPPRGVHRYVFLLFEQRPGQLVEAMAVSQRTKFDAMEFAGQHGLGMPVAATWFLAAAEAG